MQTTTEIDIFSTDSEFDQEGALRWMPDPPKALRCQHTGRMGNYCRDLVCAAAAGRKRRRYCDYHEWMYQNARAAGVRRW